MRRLAVVSAGLSVPSTTRLLADRLVELRVHARDLADNLVTGFPNESLRGVVDIVTGADRLIAVTPIFSAAYSGLLKTFFDVLETDALVGKPVLMGATGETGRHSLTLEHALRPLFAYLHAVVAPTAVFAATEDWGVGDATGRALAQRIGRAARDLRARARVRGDGRLRRVRAPRRRTASKPRLANRGPTDLTARPTAGSFISRPNHSCPARSPGRGSPLPGTRSG